MLYKVPDSDADRNEDRKPGASADPRPLMVQLASYNLKSTIMKSVKECRTKVQENCRCSRHDQVGARAM